MNDDAGDPYWIELSTEEAQTLLTQLRARLSNSEQTPPSPLVFSLEEPGGTVTNSATAADAKPAAAEAASSEFKQWVCIIGGWAMRKPPACLKTASRRARDFALVEF